MPRGITYIKPIRNSPKMAHGAAFEMSWAQFGLNWMDSAPNTAPGLLPQAVAPLVANDG